MNPKLLTLIAIQTLTAFSGCMSAPKAEIRNREAVIQKPNVAVDAIGLFKIPGNYSLPKDEADFYHLLLKAGGADTRDFGSQRVIIVRKNGAYGQSITKNIDLRSLISEGANSPLNFEILAGDIIMIPHAPF